MTVKYIASNDGTIGTLDADILSTDTEFDVTGSSAKLADLASGEAYLLCLGDPSGTREFIQCSSFSSNHFAGVTRGFESSKNGGSARGWPSGTPVTMIISAGYLGNIPQFGDVISEAEAEAGTATGGWLWSALRVRQAISFGFDASLGTSGYFKLPSWLSGVTLQWGDFSLGAPGSSTQTIILPIAFENACIMVIPVPQNSATDQIGYDSFTTTQVILKKGNNDGTARTGKWLAFGY